MKLRVLLSFALLAGLLLNLPSIAQSPKATATPAPPSPQGPAASESSVTEPPHAMTADDVHAFLDGFVPMQLERENIAGAVVLVVKDGAILFAKGYGYSDVNNRKPVTVDATLFRPGSISKLFTWTAVMQLVEQGKLDLDKDVNEYLDFKIPPKFGKPITLRNLMTHTPGFEEQVKDLITEEVAPTATLRQHLSQLIPERIFPPGTTPAYSNYGATLAGYIVERVSGESFNDYVAEKIFKPLGMTHSTFVQPLPAELKPLMSNGYNEGSGKAKPFEMIEEAPAGALAATAADLSRFMIAHLNNGKFDNTQILRPETAVQMHSRQFGLSPELNGMCLGFYEESRNGHRIIGHGGDTVYFHSDLHLMPDTGIGFFVSYNSAGKGDISPRTALWEHFLDRYFPYTPPKVEKLATADADAKAVAGYYLTSRRSESNFLKVANLVDNIQVMPDENGTIKVEPLKDFNGQLKKWQEIAPLVYRSVNGQDLIAFRRLDHNQMQLIPNFPAVVYQRVKLVDNSDFNQSLILAVVIILGLTLVFWPLGAIIRGHYHHRLELDPQSLRLRPWVRLVCAVDIAFLLIFLKVITSDSLATLSSRSDTKFHLIQTLGTLGALGTLVVLLACFRSWRDPHEWFWAKVWNLLLVLACLAFVWFSFQWNLLNFSMKY
ncbi:MAG TPA: serine hydrolase domain-containing protein [Candidatus Angelobacter sp.]|nr:serine hydrolase domain-containing protein [Candidatus Angelobacter sp.]